MASKKKSKNVSKKVSSKTVKVSSKKDKSKDSGFKIKKTYFFVFLVAIIVLLSVVILSPDRPVEEDVYRFYNGYEFIKSDIHPDVWTANIRFEDSDLLMEFWHHPLDLEDIPYDPFVNQYLFLSQRVDSRAFISWSEEVLSSEIPEAPRLGTDLARILRSFFGFEIVVSAENVEDRPWVTCEDADVDNFVFLIKKGSPRVESEPFCAILYINEDDKANKVSSLVIYHLFGIME